MKSIFLACLAMAVSIVGFAQKNDIDKLNQQERHITFSLKSGFSFATVMFDHSDRSNVRAIPSFFIGGNVNIPVTHLFSLQSGLTLIEKGFELDLKKTKGAVKTKTFAKFHPWYLEVPITAVTSCEFPSGKLLIGAGPYLSVGVAGKVKKRITQCPIAGGETSVTEREENIRFGRSSVLSAVDLGMNFTLTYQLKNRFSIHTRYGIGLLGKAKHDLCSFGLGYTFK